MNNYAKSFVLGMGIMLGSAKHHLTKPTTYMAAGCVGLGAGLKTKSLNDGIQAAAFAAIGIISYTGFSAMPGVLDDAMKDGIFEED